MIKPYSAHPCLIIQQCPRAAHLPFLSICTPSCSHRTGQTVFFLCFSKSYCIQSGKKFLFRIFHAVAGDTSACQTPRELQHLDSRDDPDADSHLDRSQHSSNGDGQASAPGQGIALVVDKEVTSYLMMGALSPGLKRHAVTLFEGAGSGLRIVRGICI